MQILKRELEALWETLVANVIALKVALGSVGMGGVLLPKSRFKRRTFDAFNWVEFNPSTLARRLKRTFD